MPRQKKIVLMVEPRKAGGAKRGRRRHHGAGWLSDVWGKIKGVAKPLNDLAKSTGIISKGLDAFGQSGLANYARQAGYGKRRRRGGNMSVKY